MHVCGFRGHPLSYDPDPRKLVEVKSPVCEPLSRHSFYATADGVGAGGERPPATRFGLNHMNIGCNIKPMPPGI
jgi:hypothetical protein